jgi:hypothetical protein
MWRLRLWMKLALAAGLGAAAPAWAAVECYEAGYRDRTFVVCLQKPSQWSDPAIESAFQESTTRLLDERYRAKGTLGPAHTEAWSWSQPGPTQNFVTTTVFEPLASGGPDFTLPVFTYKLYWSTEEKGLPSAEALGIAAVAPDSYELGQFAVSASSRLGLDGIKALAIGLLVLDRYFLFGRNGLALTTRAEPAREGARREGSPWERLYRLLGFHTVGEPLRHPTFPDWLSLAMEIEPGQLVQRLEAAEQAGAWVAERPIPATGLGHAVCRKSLSPALAPDQP